MMFALLLCLGTVSAKGFWTSAVYTQTNNPTTNEILVYHVDSAGTVSFNQTVSAQNTGGGNPNTQSSLVVIEDRLLGLNGGSDEIVMFLINTTDPTQITYQDTDSTTGTWPVTLAATWFPWGGVACVVNGMGAIHLDCYYWTETLIYSNSTWSRDLNLNLNATTGAAVSQIAFSPNNDLLVIEFKGLTDIGAMIFPIAADGSIPNLPNVYPATSPLGPKSFGFAFWNDNWVVTTDAQDGVLLYQIQNGNIVNTTTRTVLSPTGTQAYCWATVDPFTKHIYAIAAHTGNITEASVGTSNNLKEEVTVTGPWIPLTDAITAPFVNGSMDYLFVLSPKHGLTQWKIGGAGALTMVGVTTFPASVNVTAIAGLAVYSGWTSDGCFIQIPVIILLALMIMNVILA